jgi:hypothetical protein
MVEALPGPFPIQQMGDERVEHGAARPGWSAWRPVTPPRHFVSIGMPA